jgi:NADH-quinone oxidoreductase subunit B
MGETQSKSSATPSSTEILHPPSAQNLVSTLNDRAIEEMSKSFAFATRLDDLVAWGAKNALWPLPYGTACCGIELMSVMGPKYDLARFGAEVVRFSPRQADLLLVAGTITEKMVPVLVHIYEQMLDPKYVISMGACASSGGFYRSYHVLQGIDKVIPVDVFVPGCPPTPEAVLDGVMTLQRMIAEHTPRPWSENWKRPAFLKPIE